MTTSGPGVAVFSPQHADQFFALLFAGLGMLAAGAANLTRPRMSGRGRAVVAVLVGAGVAAAAGTGARTDRGSPVGLRRPAEARSAGDLEVTQDRLLRGQNLRDELVRRSPPGDETNCHGWVFTGGRFWLPGEEVGAILAGNGY